MDEDIRKRYRRDFRGEPIRVVRQQLATIVRPAPIQQPDPVIETTPATTDPVLPIEQPLPTNHKSKRRSKRPTLILSGVVMLAVIGTAGFVLVKPKLHHDKTVVLGTSIQAQYQIPAFYPTNLPTGYTFNKDFKVLAPNVLYYSVSDSSNEKFYVTLQALPKNFDFSAFKQKFLKPDEYTTDIGSVVAGNMGASLVGSIRTNNSIWILINSPAVNSLPQLETITRSFQPAK
jgi:hypothetical protein